MNKIGKDILGKRQQYLPSSGYKSYKVSAWVTLFDEQGRPYSQERETVNVRARNPEDARERGYELISKAREKIDSGMEEEIGEITVRKSKK